MKRNSRPTIGLIVGYLLESYEEQIWRSIVQTAAKEDVNLICFDGGALNDPFLYYKYKNSVYDLINPKLLDGIIILSSSVGCYVAEEEIKKFIQAFNSVPIVSIGRNFKGCPSILIDNEAGIREMMTHLIETHHYRRIAFIRGLEKNTDAEARLKAYKESLAKYSLEIDQDLIIPGDFDRHSGTTAVKVMLDERKIKADAVLAANDYMAIYAMRELQRRGIRVPEDIAVAGFDNIRDDIGVSPAITSIAQPLENIGQKAMEYIISLIHKKEVPESTCLPTRLVVRHSCGCLTALTPQLYHVMLKPRELDIKDSGKIYSSNLMIDQILNEYFPDIAEKTGNEKWSRILFEALENGGIIRQANEFLNILAPLIIQSSENGIMATYWFRVINLLFEKKIEIINKEEERNKLNEIWKASLEIIGVIAEEVQVSQIQKNKEQFIVLNRVNQGLIFSFNEIQIKNSISEELPGLDINSFSVFFYEKDSINHQYSRLFSSYDNSGRIIIENKEKPFLSKNLVPGSIRNDRGRFSYLVLPLHFKDEEIGYALCEIGIVDGAIYENLISQIGSAIKGTRLVDEVRHYAVDLEIQVEQRTRQLKEVQEQLIESAHQAGMAEIAIGVMHNVGNLLNSISVSSEEINKIINNSKLEGFIMANDLLKINKEKIGDYIQNDPKGKMLPDYYHKIGDSMKTEHADIKKELSELLQKIELIKEIIQTLQDYSYSSRVLMQEESDAAALIDIALKIQEPNMIKNSVYVVKKYPRNEKIITQKTKFIHILVNVIKNAVEAMKKSTDDRIITINMLRDEKKNLVIKISDTGEGIEKSSLTKIFSYGFTTKKEGHGFGLHTCANYMTELGGTIQAESGGPGKGAAFTMTFPPSHNKP